MVGKKFMMSYQKINTYLLIAAAAILFVFSLGFMTNFYELFYDGNTEMYEFYKNVQMLNNVVFDSALILIILAILHLPFDFHKRTVSLFGLALVSITTLVNISNVMVAIRTNTYFRKAYEAIDFSNLETYNPSLFPFQFTTIIFVITAILTISLVISSVVNFIRDRKQVINE